MYSALHYYNVYDSNVALSNASCRKGILKLPKKKLDI